MPTPANAVWTVRVYRDDSLTPVIYENVKHAFMVAGNTVLTIAIHDGSGDHFYVNWPRERFAWFRVDRATGPQPTIHSTHVHRGA